MLMIELQSHVQVVMMSGDWVMELLLLDDFTDDQQWKQLIEMGFW